MPITSAIDLRWRRITRGWRRSNCLNFAAALCLRRWAKELRARRNGGRAPAVSYLVIRLSWADWGICHFLHGKMDRNTGQIKVVSYKPNKAKKTGVELIFPGHVERGDRPPQEH